MEFRKNFELAILKGRDADATEKQQEEGKEKLKQLSGLVSKFIIRRTNDLLSKYRELPLNPVGEGMVTGLNQFLPPQFPSSTSTSSFARCLHSSWIFIACSSDLPRSRRCCVALDRSH